MNKKIIICFIVLGFLIISICKCDLIDEYPFTESDNQLSWNNVNLFAGLYFQTNESEINLTSVKFYLTNVGVAQFYFDLRIYDLSNFTGYDNQFSDSLDIYSYDISTLGQEVEFSFNNVTLPSYHGFIFGLYYLNGTINTSHYIKINRDVTPISGDNSFWVQSTLTSNILIYHTFNMCFELYGNKVESLPAIGEYTQEDLNNYFLYGGIVAFIVTFLIIVILFDKKKR